MATIMGGGLGGRFKDPSRINTRSVSIDDRKIARANPNDGSENTRYHTSTQAPGKWATKTKARVVTPVKASTRMPGGPTAIKGGKTQKTSTKWIKNIAAQKVTPTKVAAYKPAAGEASRQTAAQAQVDRAQQGDWGLNAAALAQVGLIKDWTNEAVAAAGESEIGRGMGRSGSYDAVRVDAAQEGALQAASQMANASAEQGRLNQEVAIKNAELGTSVNLENASMINDYAKFLRSQGLEEYKVQNEVNLAFKQFDEGKRQFNESHALDTTKSERGYQQDRLNYNEGIRQFNVGAGTDRYNAQTGRFSAQSTDKLGWAGLAQEKYLKEQEFANNLELAVKQAEAQGADPAYINAMTNRMKLEWQQKSQIEDRYFGSPLNPNSWAQSPTGGGAYLENQYPWLTSGARTGAGSMGR